VPTWLTEEEHRTLTAVVDRMVPADDDPGAADLGAVDYIDGLLGAFTFDPPRIWAGGPTSGRAGGEATFGRFVPLSALDEFAWRIRIEGSLGRPEREFNGPVLGLQEIYREGLARLGSDFDGCDRDEQARRLLGEPDFTQLVYDHVCEGLYGAPEYGGNRDGVGWAMIGVAGDVQPRGWTDTEVAEP
jgi:Gluconate 2-dehydrogenase subunit 3